VGAREVPWGCSRVLNIGGEGGGNSSDSSYRAISRVLSIVLLLVALLRLLIPRHFGVGPFTTWCSHRCCHICTPGLFLTISNFSNDCYFSLLLIISDSCQLPNTNVPTGVPTGVSKDVHQGISEMDLRDLHLQQILEHGTNLAKELMDSKSFSSPSSTPHRSSASSETEDAHSATKVQLKEPCVRIYKTLRTYITTSRAELAAILKSTLFSDFYIVNILGY